MNFNFYSSRKERLENSSISTQQAYERRSSKNFFKRNPHLKIMLIDLLLVLLFAVIIIPFFIKITKDVRIDDYKISSKAVLFEENILLSIKIVKVNKKIISKIGTDQIKIDIMNDDVLLESKNSYFPKIIDDKIYITFIIKETLIKDFVSINFVSGKFNKKVKIAIEQ